MSGPIETGGKVATSVVETFRGQPGFLALVLLNVALMVLIHFSSRDNRERQAQMIKMITENESRLQSLLERCLTTPRGDVQTAPSAS